jgi:aryl-alcohol dehydrogenase-like predicted oxidoreductase
MTFPNENKNALDASQAGTVTLGDLPVARMAFGTMQLPGPGIWGEPRDPYEARRVLRRAVELGINYLDTASYYGPLVSDRLIVEALYPYPAGLIIGTKVPRVAQRDVPFSPRIAQRGC